MYSRTCSHVKAATAKEIRSEAPENQALKVRYQGADLVPLLILRRLHRATLTIKVSIGVT